MPRVGLLRFETSGLCSSMPPGSFSQATAPHMLPLHSATRIWATPSATSQSPVGSAASAETMLSPENVAKSISVRITSRGRCNIV